MVILRGAGLIAGLFLLLLPLVSCSSLPHVDDLERPRYMTGAFYGARKCSECHAYIYDQWSQHSRHAIATRSAGFRRALREIMANPVVGKHLVTARMCYSCHGDEKLNEGISCESCHGPPLPGVDIMESHRLRYRPRMASMRRSDFCARCHQVSMPFTNEPLTTIHDEWRASPAAAAGKSCQDCHMAMREDDSYAYHGFRTLVRNPSLYRGWLRLQHFAINDRRVRITVVNRVMGHAIPASGPTRVLALHLRIKDATGRIIHDDVRRFFKHFSMLPLVGGVPFMLIGNSQLQAGEKRQVRFMLPAGIRKRARRVELSLRMYEVSDRDGGDLTKAYWHSAILTGKTIKLKPPTQSGR